MLSIFTFHYLYSNFLTPFPTFPSESFIVNWGRQADLYKEMRRMENREVEKHKNAQTSDDNRYTSEFLFVLWTPNDINLHKTSERAELRKIGRRSHRRRKSLHTFPLFSSSSLVKLAFSFLSFWWRRKVYIYCLLQWYISGLLIAKHRTQG